MKTIDLILIIVAYACLVLEMKEHLYGLIGIGALLFLLILNLSREDAKTENKPN